MNLCDLTATELLDVFRSGTASPVDAVKSCLRQIEVLDRDVNAILTLVEERCLEKAAVSEQRWRVREPRLLEGIPFGVKDVIQTAGVRTTGGSKIYGDLVPTESAVAVQRLEAEGALLLAKTQTYEFAVGDNSHYGPTRNPWDLGRSTGGSSSGSAAALAAREMPLAIGTDTGGSIRIPSTLCGVTGLKPTFGRVPRHGAMTLSWTLDHVGPMARSVRDVALMFKVMAGYDARDPTSIQLEPSHTEDSFNVGVKGIRLGVPKDWFFELIDPAVESSTSDALAALEEEGAELVEVRLPNAHLSEAIGWTIIYAEAASMHESTLNRLDEYSAPMTQEFFANAQFVSARDYLKALRTMHVIQSDFQQAFDTVDALVVPGVVATAPRLDDMVFQIDRKPFPWGDVVARLTLIFNIAGLPALAVPSGMTDAGLPVGIQIAAPPLREDTCFRIGHTYQQITSHHLQAPPVRTDQRLWTSGFGTSAGK